MKVFLGTTAVLFCIYLLWFGIQLIRTVILFCQITIRSRIMFLMSILMLLILVGSVIVGVFSPFYANGGLLMFFIALFNIYVMSLVYLNWPKELG